MTADPRAALSLLVAALERHLEVATSRRDPDDPAVVAAALDLADAFDDYDEALFLSTEVMTPLIVDADDDEDDEDDEDEHETDDLDGAVGDVASGGVYSGLEDDDLDYGDDESSDDDDDADDDDDDDDDDADDDDDDLDDDDDEDDDDDDDLEDDEDDEDDDEDELDDDGKRGHLAPSHH